MKLQVYGMMALLCAATAACKKERVDSMPTGKNTFSCLIDGKHFTPKLPVIILVPRKALQARRINRLGGFYIQARDTHNKVNMYFTVTQGAGTYPLGYTLNTYPYSFKPQNYGEYRYFRSVTPNDDPYTPIYPAQYYTSATHTGTVTVTRFDTVARVAGGSFEFTAKDDSTGKLVRITKGQFDVLF